MKKITILIWFIIFAGNLLSQEGDLNFEVYQYDESTHFFNPNYVTNIPFFYPQNNFTGGQIYFGLADINSGRIDIAVALNSSDGIVSNQTIWNYYRKGNTTVQLKYI